MSIKTKLKQIYEGWGNHLFPSEEAKELIETISNKRLEICTTCPEYSEKGFYKHCKQCGCAFPAKTKCMSCQCPLNKWQPLITKDEENQLKIEECL